MFEYIFSFFYKKKQNCYTESQVKYVLSELLRQTIDREILKKALKQKIGNNSTQLIEIFHLINELEIEEDNNKIEYWIIKLKELKRDNQI